MAQEPNRNRTPEPETGTVGTVFKGIAKGGVKNRNKGRCKRLFAFVHVCSRLLAFACVCASAFACVCPLLSALACVCSHLLTPLTMPRVSFMWTEMPEKVQKKKRTFRKTCCLYSGAVLLKRGEWQLKFANPNDLSESLRSSQECQFGISSHVILPF